MSAYYTPGDCPKCFTEIMQFDPQDNLKKWRLLSPSLCRWDEESEIPRVIWFTKGHAASKWSANIP